MALNELYRKRIPIERLYAIDARDPRQTANAWAAQGDLAASFVCPWEDRRQSDLRYAIRCYQRALAEDSAYHPALNNLMRVLAQAGRWADCERLLCVAAQAPAGLSGSVQRRQVPEPAPVDAVPYIQELSLVSGGVKHAAG